MSLILFIVIIFNFISNKRLNHEYKSGYNKHKIQIIKQKLNLIKIKQKQTKVNKNKHIIYNIDSS